MFPEVKKNTNQYNSADRNERYRYQAPIVMRYLKNKLLGWSVTDFLEEIGAKRVALYAVTDFTEYMLLDLLQACNLDRVLCIGDKSCKKYDGGLYDVPVVAPETLVEAYQSREIDRIIICSVSHANVIFDELVKRGVAPADIVTVTSAIFSFVEDKEKE